MLLLCPILSTVHTLHTVHLSIRPIHAASQGLPLAPLAILFFLVLETTNPSLAASTGHNSFFSCKEMTPWSPPQKKYWWPHTSPGDSFMVKTPSCCEVMTIAAVKDIYRMNGVDYRSIKSSECVYMHVHTRECICRCTYIYIYYACFGAYVCIHMCIYGLREGFTCSFLRIQILHAHLYILPAGKVWRSRIW